MAHYSIIIMEGGVVMRIENFSQIQQLYSTTKPSAYSAGSAGKDFKDKLNISSAGKDLNVAKQAVAAAPDVRADKIAELKSAIGNGTYDISGYEFADHIMDKLSQTLA